MLIYRGLMAHLSALLLFPVLLGLGACGSAEGRSGPALSKASYVRQANAICDQTKVKAKEFGTHAPTSAADFEVQLDKAYALLSDSTAKLNHLHPPADDRDQLNAAFLGPLNGQTKVLGDYLTAFKAAAAQGPAGLRKLAQLHRPPQLDLNLVRAYGLTSCLGTNVA